jgi:hypothetical protein
MAQFYLLSVLANLVAGLTLAGDYLGDRVKFLASFKILRENRTSMISVGLIALVVGLITLFVRAPGDTVPVAGDLLPSLAGIAQGLVLLVEAFRQRVESSSQQAERISKAVLTYRVPAGIAGVAIACLHFLFPAAVLL